MNIYIEYYTLYILGLMWMV